MNLVAAVLIDIVGLIAANVRWRVGYIACCQVLDQQQQAAIAAGGKTKRITINPRPILIG